MEKFKYTNKSASQDAIKWANKNGLSLGGRASWEDIFDGLEGYTLGVGTECESQGGNTAIVLYKEDTTANTFHVPSKQIFSSADGDWDWQQIYKMCVTWLMGGPGKKTPKKSTEPNDLAQLKARKTHLYNYVRNHGKKGEDVSKEQAELLQVKALIKKYGSK